MSDDAFPKVTIDQLEGDADHLFLTFEEALVQMGARADEVARLTGKTPMTRDVTVLHEARRRMEAIVLRSHRINYEFPNGPELKAAHDDAVAAIEIIDSLRWLWDELVPTDATILA